MRASDGTCVSNGVVEITLGALYEIMWIDRKSRSLFLVSACDWSTVGPF